MLNRRLLQTWKQWISLLVLCLAGITACTGSDSSNSPPASGMTIHFRPAQAQENNWTAKLNETGSSLPAEKSSFGWRFQSSTTAERVILTNGSKSLSYELDSSRAAHWLYEQSQQAFPLAPPVLPNETELVVYWQNEKPQPETWGLHLWDDTAGADWTTWAEPLAPTRSSTDFGTLFQISLPPLGSYSAAPRDYKNFPTRMGLIVHQGDEKSATENQYLEPTDFGGLFFLKESDATIYCTPDFQPCGSRQTRIDASAHWVAPQQLLWQQRPSEGWRFALIASASGSLRPDQLDIEDKLEIPINPSAEQGNTSQFPHLAAFTAYQLPELEPKILDQLMQSQLVAAAWDQGGQLQAFSQIQTPFVMDALYGTDEALGLVLSDSGPASLRFWSPTAKELTLEVFDQNKEPLTSIPMKRNNKAVWSAVVENDWLQNRLFYRFRLTTLHPEAQGVITLSLTDPYAVSLATDSLYAQFVDLSAPDLKPEGWDNLQKNKVAKTDISILETHVRDFSAFDPSVPEELRGRYLAFTERADGDRLSLGRRYLKSLAEAGLSHLQLLPVNDIATVIEDPARQVNLDAPFTDLCTKSSAPQSLCHRPEFQNQSIREVFAAADPSTALVQDLNKYLHEVDAFNWGYDPFHYGVPEGSYATDPDGVARIKEFRELVSSVAKLGLQLSIDVVYNHTFASGLFRDSVLDKAVPGYYHRRDPITGSIANSTCCANTASEHKMMQRLMIDTLQRWVQDYKVDAFRFDLMGHHMKRNMLAVQEALGEDIYLYGEGWNFGEVADNQRGINATQLNLAGSGIGTFNDRLRDSVRGGGPFDCGVLLFQQGYGNGLFVNDNEKGGLLQPTVSQPNCLNQDDYTAQSVTAKKANFAALSDRIRIGLAGSLAAFELTDANGELKAASQFGSPNYPIGYTDQPWETINYISKHDNQTLWDINQIKLPLSMNLEQRVAVQEFGMSLNALAQGIPFFHFGVDLLRSKSLNRDSYNSGDWFNRVDFSFQDNNWNVGLPRRDKDGDNYPFFAEILAAVPEAPRADLIERSHDYFRSLLSIRTSSPLFRLPDAKAISERVSFLNTGPQSDARTGVIIMKIDDSQCRFTQDLDPELQDVVIVFNPKPSAIELQAARGYQLHPALRERLSLGDDLKLEIPAFASAVLTRSQQSDCLSGDVSW